MIKVHITSDERMEGKTTLAWSLMRFLRGLGHNVKVITEYFAEKEVIEGDDNFTRAIAPRDVIVSTVNGLEGAMSEDVKKLAEDWIQRQPYFNPNAPNLINKVAEATGIIRELLALIDKEELSVASSDES